MPRLLTTLAFGPPLYALGLGSGLVNRFVRRYAEYKPAAYPAHDIDESVRHVRDICNRWQAALDRLAPGESFAGKRVLELGPGHSLGTGMVLLARGAKAYTAVDIGRRRACTRRWPPPKTVRLISRGKRAFKLWSSRHWNPWLVPST